jgi:hypothetical protein
MTTTVAGLIMEQIAKREYPALPRLEGIEKVAQKYTNLWDAHCRDVQRGEVAAVSVPVQKAAPLSEHEQLFATITKRAEALAARTGIPNERAVADVFAADPGLYEKYRAAVSKRATPSTP